VTRTLVIWNPTAGGGSEGDLDERRETIRAALLKAGVDAELYESPSEEATASRVKQAVEDGTERIVAAGGDHTVRSIAFQLLGRETVLGILPLGTAMNIAQSLDIPLKLEEAAAVLASGSVRSIDVGYIGDHPFLEVATIGLAADLLEDATNLSEGRVGALIDFVRRGIQNRRTRVWIDLDGREIRHRVVSLAIANGRFTGRALEVAPDARIDDGQLDLVCFLGYGPLEFVKELVKVSTGLGSGTRTARYRGRRVTVRSHHPLPVRADSSDFGTTPVAIESKAKQLRVLAPG
jgi:diacylglycerol kinase (ATP)